LLPAWQQATRERDFSLFRLRILKGRYGPEGSSNAERPAAAAYGLWVVMDVCLWDLVAGIGFEPMTFRL
jgi:hypothetical protein